MPESRLVRWAMGRGAAVVSASPRARGWARRLTRWAAARQRVGAQAVVLDHGCVLVVRSALRPDEWGLPGGWIRSHEDPATAAVREVGEEVGLDVAAEAVVACQTHPVDRRPVVGQPSGITIVYLCRPDRRDMTPDPTRTPEIIDVAWMPADEACTVLGPFESRAVTEAIRRRASIDAVHGPCEPPVA